MPVTIKPTTNAPRKWRAASSASSTKQLLEQACPKESRQCKRIFQSSFHDFSTETPIWPSANGFVHAAIRAYSWHHHLTIRPDDVWFSILAQLGIFINNHAEELRSFFVAHSGRKALEVVEVGTIETVDFGVLALKMTEMIAKNMNDPKLRAWIMPTFSTTTASDKAVAAVLMMGAMQEYFSYNISLGCGIPSITLRADWEEMLKKLEMLPQLGHEPARFYTLLKPVLRGFVDSFDRPTDPVVIDFWNKIAHEPGGSGYNFLSGWIVAFCFWNSNGKRLYHPLDDVDESWPGCNLDGTRYHIVKTDEIPDGHAAVPVRVNDNGCIYDTRMVAGSVGIYITSSGDILDEGHDHNDSRFKYGPDGQRVPYISQPQQGQAPGLDSSQPVSGWWIYEVNEAAEGVNSDKEGPETLIEGEGNLGLRDEAAQVDAPPKTVPEPVGA